MTERQRQVRMNIAAFLLLFIVSLYRQVSLRYLPDDPFRTYILYACYLFLIGGWAISICARVTQKSMRTFLMFEMAVMLAGLTVRFLQDTFWIEKHSADARQRAVSGGYHIIRSSARHLCLVGDRTMGQFPGS